MKKYGGVPVWIIFTTVGLSLGFSIWALIMANAKPFSFFQFEFNYTKLVELTGLIFSVLGVVLTVYFVIIGINATRIEKELSYKKDQIEKELKKIECDNLDEIYGQIIRLTETVSKEKKRKSILNSINLSRARLATQSRFLSKEKRLQRMLALDMLGNIDDIVDLVKIINDPTEDKEIIESSKMRKEEIEKRLG